MGERLTTQGYWADHWAGRRLPELTVPRRDIHQVLAAHLPVSADLSLFEVGCALGGWMAYFHRQFHYKVGGIEYVEPAAQATRRNMEMLNVPATVEVGDFFQLDRPRSSDIVYSAGFIEHFEDLDGVVRRICSMARKYVVTLVPNFVGLLGLTNRLFNRPLYDAHRRIDATMLRNLHEKAGVTTLFCDYLGGIHFEPLAIGPIFARHQKLARILNFPFRAANRVMRLMNDKAGFAPRTRLLTPAILYVGAVP